MAGAREGLTRKDELKRGEEERIVSKRCFLRKVQGKGTCEAKYSTLFYKGKATGIFTAQVLWFLAWEVEASLVV